MMRTLRHSQPSLMRSAIDAAMIMAIGMGFGRFAFTAIYPHMVDEGVLSLQGGGLAASANYAGYLFGAILGARARPATAHRLCLWSTAGTIVCLSALAVLDATWAIIAMRGAAGVFSALTMVAASLWLLGQRQHMHGAPLLYAGVGVGIALSSELLVVGTHLGLQSHALWLLLGGAALLIGLVATPGLLAGTRAPVDPTRTKPTSSAALVKPWPLIAVYGLAGFGYIVTATYLPLLVRSALPNLESAHVWAVFGLGAAPSCFLWHSIHQRLGTRKALAVNLVVQAVGVALPIFSQTAAAYLLSALLVGGTFTGTVTIAMPAAQRLAGKVRGNLVATMTLVYGIGQIAGPILANALYAQSQTFFMSLATAATALIVAALMSAFAL